MHPPAAVAPEQVKAVRAFNRFYTQRIGVLKPYLDSDFTLTEVRILYELAHHPGLAARDLVRELALDAGYLSRILRRFEQQGWLTRASAADDARRQLLRLTEAGYAAFAPLQQKSRDETGALLAEVPPADRPRLLAALGTVRQLLQAQPPPQRQVLLPSQEAPQPRVLLPSQEAPQPRALLREPQPGDHGWVVEQHGALYAREYGYTVEFEALVAGIVARIIERFDPAWEKAWIAEVDGQRAGSVFVVRKSATVAQLRLLILTPQARGLGLGGRLTDACIAFAREKGYRKLVLWTNGQLDAARAIYRSRGFRLTRSEPLAAYGQQLTSEIWELPLTRNHPAATRRAEAA